MNPHDGCITLGLPWTFSQNNLVYLRDSFHSNKAGLHNVSGLINMQHPQLSMQPGRNNNGSWSGTKLLMERRAEVRNKEVGFGLLWGPPEGTGSLKWNHFPSSTSPLPFTLPKAKLSNFTVWLDAEWDFLYGCTLA